MEHFGGGDSRRESKEEGNRVRSKMRNYSKVLRARLCHTDTKPVRQGELFLKSKIHVLKLYLISNEALFT